jgi:hypothetical protein
MRLYKQVLIAMALSLASAAFLSNSLWGYALKRPGVPTAALDALYIKSMLVVSNWRRENAGMLQKNGSWQELLTLSKNHPYDIPEGRALIAWNESDLLNKQMNETPIETAEKALEAVSSFFPEGADGYKSTAKNRSALVVVFDGEIGKDLIFVAARGGQIRNDHFGYREFVLVPGEKDYKVLQQSGFQFDVAGIEGLEFPHLFVIFFVLLILFIGLFNLKTWRGRPLQLHHENEF